MSRRHAKAAFGFRVKSGWAAAVLLSLREGKPAVLESLRITLSDSRDPETLQPYHASAGTLEQDPVVIRRRIRKVQAATQSSVQELLGMVERHGVRVARAGLVVGSLTDPATVRHPHMGAHALEGQLFRTVLSEALEGVGVACLFLVEQGALPAGVAALGRSAPSIRAALCLPGKEGRRPWRAEQKLATLAAWMALAGSFPSRFGSIMGKGPGGGSPSTARRSPSSRPRLPH